jgi:hypothetical protein
MLISLSLPISSERLNDKCRNTYCGDDAVPDPHGDPDNQHFRDPSEVAQRKLRGRFIGAGVFSVALSLNPLSPPSLLCSILPMSAGTIWSHHRICSKTLSGIEERGAEISQGRNFLFEPFGRSDVVAIEADVVPAETSDLSDSAMTSNALKMPFCGICHSTRVRLWPR